MTLDLTREEALACIIALEHKRDCYGGWGKSALKKLLALMGLEPRADRVLK